MWQVFDAFGSIVLIDRFILVVLEWGNTAIGKFLQSTESTIGTRRVNKKQSSPYKSRKPVSVVKSNQEYIMIAEDDSKTRDDDENSRIVLILVLILWYRRTRNDDWLERRPARAILVGIYLTSNVVCSCFPDSSLRGKVLLTPFVFWLLSADRVSL